MVEKEKNKSYLKRRKRVSPNDCIEYKINNTVILKTIDILKEYGKSDAEGLVYWAGKPGNGSIIEIDCIIAPKLSTSRYGFQTSPLNNSFYIEYLMDHDRIHIGQVHSHPGTWVDHSYVDDNETAFRSNGLLSLVVASFGINGMIPLKSCGVHRFEDCKFLRLSNKYILAHFDITSPATTLFKDFRND